MKRAQIAANHRNGKPKRPDDPASGGFRGVERLAPPLRTDGS